MAEEPLGPGVDTEAGLWALLQVVGGETVGEVLDRVEGVADLFARAGDAVGAEFLLGVCAEARAKLGPLLDGPKGGFEFEAVQPDGSSERYVMPPETLVYSVYLKREARRDFDGFERELEEQLREEEGEEFDEEQFRQSRAHRRKLVGLPPEDPGLGDTPSQG